MHSMRSTSAIFMTCTEAITYVSPNAIVKKEWEIHILGFNYLLALVPALHAGQSKLINIYDFCSCVI